MLNPKYKKGGRVMRLCIFIQFRLKYIEFNGLFAYVVSILKVFAHDKMDSQLKSIKIPKGES